MLEEEPGGRPAEKPATAVERQRVGELLAEHNHNPASLALALVRSEARALLDNLDPDLLNNQGLEKAVSTIESEQERWKRAGRQEREEMAEPKGAVVFLDADNLHHFNEVGQELGWGQAEGDKFLIAISLAIKEALGRREIDVAARIHGDEFVVILPKMSEEAAKNQWEKFCQALERLGRAYRKELKIRLEEMGVEKEARQEIAASCRYSASAALAEWGETRKAGRAITAASSAILKAKTKKKKETKKKRGGHVGIVAV